MTHQKLKIEKAVYSVPEVAAVLGLSENYTYEAIAQKWIPAVRIGKRILVPKVALEKWPADSAKDIGSDLMLLRSLNVGK